jgi:hypothetical protein
LLVAAPAMADDAAKALQLRCGWFDNPSPANATLSDADGEWLIGMQGGHQAEGDWPRFSRSQWVKSNRSYGHGCACMRVEVDPASHEVRRIASARARALDACRKDAKLTEPQ